MRRSLKRSESSETWGPKIGQAQLEVLRYIADHHPATVREVADHFAHVKGYARTTVLTIMERLREKRFLTRRRVGGIYQYSPRVPKTQALQALVRSFVEQALGGSVQPFVVYLTRRYQVSDAEMKELAQLIRKLEAREIAAERKTRVRDKAQSRGSKLED